MDDSSKPPKSRRTIKRRWALMSLPNQLMACATIIIAVAAIVNLGVAIAMWNEMRNGGKDTHELAVAARDEWRELNETKSFIRDNFYQPQSRPWIGIVGNALAVKQVESSHAWKVSYQVKNYGLSPARRVVRSYDVQSGEIPKWSGHLCEDIDIKRVSNSREPADIIFPTEVFPFSDTVRAATPLEDGKKQWLIVRVAYHDVSGPKSQGCVALFYSLDSSKVIGAESY
jgi:hypothetical protein